jgi:pyruvate formate lyase activating enzyme
MLQINFLTEVLKKCKENGILTAVDTAGNVPWKSFEQCLPFTDLFLYDIKSMDSDVHKKYTGVSNELILKNLEKLLKTKARVWVRVPVIPTVNDIETNFKILREFYEKNGYPEKTERLPYHAMGESKYEALEKTVQKFNVPTQEEIDKLNNIVYPTLYARGL